MGAQDPNYDPLAYLRKEPAAVEVRLGAYPMGEIVFDVGWDRHWHVSAHGFGRENPFRWLLRSHYMGETPPDRIAAYCREKPRPGESHLFADSCHLRREGDWVRFGIPNGITAYVRIRTLAIALGCLNREAERLMATAEDGEIWDGEGPIPEWLEEMYREAQRLAAQRRGS